MQHASGEAASYGERSERKQFARPLEGSLFAAALLPNSRPPKRPKRTCSQTRSLATPALHAQWHSRVTRNFLQTAVNFYFVPNPLFIFFSEKTIYVPLLEVILISPITSDQSSFLFGRHVVELENFVKILLVFTCCWQGKEIIII